MWSSGIAAGLLLLVAGASAQVDAARDDYNFAAGLHDRGLHDRAVGAFEAYLKAWPNDSRVPKARFYLGESLATLGKPEEALPHLLASSRTDHSLRPEARLRAGEILHRLSRDAEAIPLLQAVCEGDRDDLRAAAWYFLAESQEGSGHRDLALKAYEEVLRRDPDGTYAPFAQGALGFLRFDAGQHEEALGHFRAASRSREPSDLVTESKTMIGECLLALGKPRQALEAFTQIRDGDPGRFDAQVRRGVLRAQLDLREWDAALVAYRDLRSHHPTDAAAHGCLIRAAAALHEKGQDQDGLKLVSAIEGATGKEAQEAVYWSGLLLSRTGALEDAVASLRKAAAQDATPERLFNLADVLSKAGHFKEAAQLFSQVRGKTKDPRINAEATFAEAYAHNQLADYKQACALLERLQGPAVSGDLSQDATFALAENRFALEDYEGARPGYASLLRQEGLPAERAQACLYKAGWCDYLLGRHEAARKSLEELLLQHPRSSFTDDATYLIGKCHEAEGRPADARRVFADLAKRRPAPELAAKALVGSGAAARAAGDLEAAADSYRRAAKQAPDATTRALALVGLGDVLLELGKPKEAVDAYLSALEEEVAHPRLSEAGLNLAWALRALDRHEDAIRAITPLQTSKDLRVRGEALYLRALEETSLSRWEKVPPLLETFDQQCPDHERGNDARLLHAIALARSGDTRSAEAAFSSLVARTPHVNGRDSALYEWAFLLDGRSAGKERDVLFRRLVEEHPDSAFVPDVLFRLAESAYASGTWPEALALYRALAERPDGKDFRDKALYKAGWCLKRMDQHGEAAGAFAAVAANADSPLAAESCFLAGEQLQNAGRHSDAAKAFATMVAHHGRHVLAKDAAIRELVCRGAVEDWNDVVRMGPTVLSDAEPGPWTWRAWSAVGDGFLAKGSPDRARTAYRMVTRASEGETAARAQYQIGLTHMKENDHAKAIDELLKVTILYGNPQWSARASLLAGDLLIRGGEPAKARKILEDIVGMGWDIPEIKEAKMRLEGLRQGEDR